MSLWLEVSHLYKSYDGKSVLKDCSFSFEKEGTYVIMGSNGSGKSTLFRICALLEDHDKGEVNYREGNTLLPNNIDLRRRITLLLPRVGVFNTTTIKNVTYGLKIRGMKGKEVRERSYKALEFVGLMHKKDQNALTLSSGETQRLGIARAIIVEPDVLFLDEPTAFVDEENKTIIENIVIELKRQHSLVIITTHDRAQAERLGDQLLFIEDGKIISS